MREFAAGASRSLRRWTAALALCGGLPAVAALLRWRDPLFLLPCLALALLLWQSQRMDPAGLLLRSAQGKWWIREPDRSGLRPCELSSVGRIDRLLWLRVQWPGVAAGRQYIAFPDAFSDRDWRLLRRELQVGR